MNIFFKKRSNYKYAMFLVLTGTRRWTIVWSIAMQRNRAKNDKSIAHLLPTSFPNQIDFPDVHLYPFQAFLHPVQNLHPSVPTKTLMIACWSSSSHRYLQICVHSIVYRTDLLHVRQPLLIRASYCKDLCPEHDWSISTQSRTYHI